MIYETIKIEHQEFGPLICRILERRDGIITIWCQPLPREMHFDNPTQPIRYFYTLRSAIKAAENDGVVASVDPNSIRYSNIMQYGCNQWPICSLRKYLNGSFKEGFSEEVQEKIILTKNDICISIASAKADIEISEEHAYKCEEEHYDIYGKIGNNTRFTHSVTEDWIYLPSVELFYTYNIEDNDRVFSGENDELKYYWLMNPTPAGDEFSVNCITQYYNTQKNSYCAYQTLANANSMNIAPSPVFRMKE